MSLLRNVRSKRVNGDGVMDGDKDRVPPPVRLWHRLSPASQDGLLAFVAAAVAWSGAMWEAPAPLPPAGMWPGMDVPLVSAGLCVMVAGPLAVRRRFPVTVALGSLAAALLGPGLLGLPQAVWPARLVAALAFCSAAYHRPRRFAVLLAVSLAATILPLLLSIPVGDSMGPPIAGPALLTQAALIGIAPVVTGYALRLHRERAEQLAQLHRARAARVVAEERAWIAREIHDAVGHHLTAISMQASATAHVVTDAPPVVVRALGTIKNLSATALRDVRLLLEALRDDGNNSASRGLDDLPELAAGLSTPACRIELTLAGAERPLAAVVDHGGYRLVQEALTNAVRHSGAKLIKVDIYWVPDAVILVVEDDGPTVPPPGGIPLGPGTGLHGMRERARLLGGALSITPRHPHGWRIHAVLPAREPARDREG